jgi:undecaprenyl-diphosphatase
MHHVVADLIAIDRSLMEVGEALRWTPATAVFVLVSAWWVKGPLFFVAALVRDIRNRVPPVTAVSVAIAVVVGDALATLIKHMVDRNRPPAEEAAVALPGSPSFPSGHATTAFAAAAVIGVLCPRLRVPAFALAALIGFSRFYLGVHFTIDVLVGALLGTLVGVLIGLGGRRVARAVAEPAPAPAH